MVSEGFMPVSYIDEQTLEEKQAMSPIYSFDISAESLSMARYICKMMGLGVENRDFQIFEVPVDDLSEVDKENYYQSYVLN